MGDTERTTGSSIGVPPTSYSLEILTLVNNFGEQFDVRNLLMECKIYESITSNFLLGEIGLQDATDFINNAKIVGQESLRIRFKHPGAEHNDDIIDQTFRVYKVSGVGRLGQDTSIFKLSFCSPEFIHAKRHRLTQAFSGNYSDIAVRIAQDHLGIEEKESGETGYPKSEGPYWESIVKSKDEAGSVIIPNWTISYAINWLCNKAQGKQDGSGIEDSFFFYQTANGGFKLEPITDMLATDYLSGDTFSFTPASQGGLWNEPLGPGKRILSYTMGNTSNVLEAIMGGMFGSRQTTIDTHKKNYSERDYSYLEDFYTIQNKDSIQPGDKGLNKYPLVWREPDTTYQATAPETIDAFCQPFQNWTMAQKSKNISLYPEAHHILTSKNSFVHDSEGIVKSVSEKGIEEGVIQFRTAVKQLLKYHTMNALISARTDIQTGQMINLVIPPTRPAAAKSRQNFLHSGKYLITEIMWDLTLAECKTNIKVIKDAYANDIDSYESDYSERLEE